MTNWPEIAVVLISMWMHKISHKILLRIAQLSRMPCCIWCCASCSPKIDAFQRRSVAYGRLQLLYSIMGWIVLRRWLKWCSQREIIYHWRPLHLMMWWEDESVRKLEDAYRELASILRPLDTEWRKRLYTALKEENLAHFRVRRRRRLFHMRRMGDRW